MLKSGEEDGWTNVGEETMQPSVVVAVPRLADDIAAFEKLCYSKEPPLRRARCSKFASTYYGFGDASKSGFGATLQFGNDIEYKYGQWSWESDQSSNWQELNNLVKFEVCSKDLEGCELFIFTDNMTAEAAFWKGSSRSRNLVELVLRLRKLEMEHGMIIHVVHISGRRMIQQGSDGLSRADHSEGVMQERPMVDYVPLHLDSMEREPRLKTSLDSVTLGLEPEYLGPEDWFDEGQGLGTFVWTPAPAAGEVVVEQLGRARLKRPESMHIVVIPRVMTGRWRHHLTRGTNVYFKLDWEEVWPLSAQYYEPLLIFVCLPYGSHSPNLESRAQLLEDFRRFMLRDELSKVPEVQRRDFLRKYLQRAWALQALP
jgi:hypothetical protein